MPVENPPATPALAAHFSPAQIAEYWGVSEDTVRRLFENEPGVLAIETSNGRYRRRKYRVLRIPLAVVEQVHRKFSVVAPPSHSTRGQK